MKTTPQYQHAPRLMRLTLSLMALLCLSGITGSHVAFAQPAATMQRNATARSGQSSARTANANKQRRSTTNNAPAPAGENQEPQSLSGSSQKQIGIGLHNREQNQRSAPNSQGNSPQNSQRKAVRPRKH